jgi:hypothetical protein
MVHILEAPCFHEQQLRARRFRRAGMTHAWPRWRRGCPTVPEYMRALALAGAVSSSSRKRALSTSGPRFQGEMCTAP